MAEVNLVGQDLLDLVQSRLGGYGNYGDTTTLMSYLNEGKDEVWAVLKSLNTDYFTKISQTTDNTQLNYFANFATSTRQYTLPTDFREMTLFIVTDPAYAQTKFTYKKIQDRDFQDALKSSNVDNTLTPTVEYLYTILGRDQLLLASFPEYPFTPQIYYTSGLLDFEIDDTIDQILIPYVKKIADFASMKIMLSAQDQDQFEEWRKTWKDSLLMIATSAGPRNLADPEFVADFNG